MTEGLHDHPEFLQGIRPQLHRMMKLETLGSLAGGFAHKLNNLFAIIQLNSSMARDKISRGEDARGEIRDMEDALARARSLTTRLQVLGGVDYSEPSVIKLQEALRGSEEIIRAAVPSSVEMVLDLDAHCGPVWMDPLELDRMLINLCINAQQAMVEKGALVITLREKVLAPEDIDEQPGLQPGRYARLSVADTGCGIEEKNLPRIFEHFFTAWSAGSGTGLGLSTVLDITTARGGTVAVESEVGQGTTFHLYFPVAEEAEPAVAVEDDREALAGPRTGNASILIADDETQVAGLGRRILERNGYRVVLCTGGREALEVFNASPEKFDLVITDHNMPEMNGLELAVEIREIRPRIPILFCTGYSSRFTGNDIGIGGICSLLTKPYKASELIAAVKKILGDP